MKGRAGIGASSTRARAIPHSTRYLVRLHVERRDPEPGQRRV